MKTKKINYMFMFLYIDVQVAGNKIDDTTVEITELPIHKWTQNYKLELEAMMGEKGDGPVKV